MNSQINELGLSLNALTDNDTYNTIWIKGNCQGQNLIILINNEVHIILLKRARLRS